MFFESPVLFEFYITEQKCRKLANVCHLHGFNREMIMRYSKIPISYNALNHYRNVDSLINFVIHINKFGKILSHVWLLTHFRDQLKLNVQICAWQGSIEEWDTTGVKVEDSRVCNITYLICLKNSNDDRIQEFYRIAWNDEQDINGHLGSLSSSVRCGSYEFSFLLGLNSLLVDIHNFWSHAT